MNSDAWLGPNLASVQRTTPPASSTSVPARSPSMLQKTPYTPSAVRSTKANAISGTIQFGIDSISSSSNSIQEFSSSPQDGVCCWSDCFPRRAPRIVRTDIKFIKGADTFYIDVAIVDPAAAVFQMPPTRSHLTQDGASSKYEKTTLRQSQHPRRPSIQIHYPLRD